MRFNSVFDRDSPIGTAIDSLQYRRLQRTCGWHGTKKLLQDAMSHADIIAFTGDWAIHLSLTSRLGSLIQAGAVSNNTV
jgi:hypothetical protein